MSPGMSAGVSPNKPKVLVVYDAACPFCSAYIRLLRIQRLASVELLDARHAPDVVDAWRQRGYDLDEGMVVQIDQEVYFGGEAIHVLSMISGRSGFLNKLNYRIFRSRRFAMLAYPLMRRLRNMSLSLLGRKKLGGLG